METAAKILIAGGVLNLAYGFLTGLFMASVRRTSPEAPRYLVSAHVAPLMQGAMLLGLTFAVGLSTLPAGVETLGASLLVAASALLAAADTLCWLQGIEDAFAERPPGLFLGVTQGTLASVGLAILTVGVFRGL